MQILCLSLTTSPQICHFQHHFYSQKPLSKPLHHVSYSSVTLNPLRVGLNKRMRMPNINKRGMRSTGSVCYSSSAILATRNLQWISAVSTAILMLVKGTAINRSFLVPLFALQAPASILSWMQGEYGAWYAFLALLVRLFFFIPGELELPFFSLVFVLVAPRQAMNLRETQGGAILSLALAAYLAFQHFTRVGGLQKSFDQGSIFATLAIIGITFVSCLLLI